MVDASFPSRFGEDCVPSYPILPRFNIEKRLNPSRMLRNRWDGAASKEGFSVSEYRIVRMCMHAAFSGMLILCCARAQNKAVTTQYGANPTAGHYLRVDDANIYYETYGSGGTPLVLLHGGLYGYIEEFGELIEELSKHRRVIAIATRGHGKSDLGTKPFSYALFANDAFAVIHHETGDKVDVLGFSDGAVTSYTLASTHPELIRRLVAISGSRKFTDSTPSAQAEFKNAKPSDVERDSPQFVLNRKKLMPQPERWLEFNEKLHTMWAGPVYVTDAQIQSIKVPTLIVAGDHDPHNPVPMVGELFQLLPKGELAIIPGCGHVVLACKGQFTINAVELFLDQQER